MAGYKILAAAVCFIIFSSFSAAQSAADSMLDRAYYNAKKGYWWALENIPKKKQQDGKDLISDNRLISSVKLSKEINGIRVESTGYNESCEIKLLIYRSNDSLLKEGFIKPDTAIAQSKAVPPIKQLRKKKTSAR